MQILPLALLKVIWRISMEIINMLPFEDGPRSLMYHNTAFSMGIIEANAATDITPWLCNKYINCWFFKDRNSQNKFNISTIDNWATSNKVLILERINLIPDLFEMAFGDVIEFLKRRIANGSYPHGTYNEEFIPGKRDYKNKYFAHDYLLIGYNDYLNEFTSVGYLANERFQRFQISYDDFYKAIRTLRNSTYNINFWKFNSHAPLEINTNFILQELIDYTNSNTSMKIYSQNRWWGIDAIIHLALYFEDQCDYNNQFDNRYTRGLMEHKYFMLKRIEYFINTSIIRNDAEIFLECAKTVYQKSQLIHMLSIKYNISGNKKYGIQIINLIHDMVDCEKSYIYDVVEMLKSHIKGAL